MFKRKFRKWFSALLGEHQKEDNSVPSGQRAQEEPDRNINTLNIILLFGAFILYILVL